MHLVIYFCGTGNPGDSFYNHYDYIDPSSPVRTILVEGCDHPEVCNAGLFPDLKKFATRFSEQIFNRDNQSLNLTTMAMQDLTLGINPSRSTINEDDAGEKIESITLCGYSRGAVTCFEIAKQLNKIAPFIPVDIVADQPVPGNYYQAPGTNASSIADCSNLKNLRNVSIILGAYTGSILNNDQTENVALIHRGFFSQIIPKLPHTAHRDLIVIPRESHHQDRPNSPDGEGHLHMQLAKYLTKKKLVTPAALAKKTQEAANTYKMYNQVPATYPPVSQLQHFFGIKKETLYKYTDKLHPAAHLRKGWEWQQDESLAFWWDKHEKKASYFSTNLTKQLIGTINKTNEWDPASLRILFAQADNWLILKQECTSSRYYQVESLRNNIYERLIINKHNTKLDLALINRANLHNNEFFLTHWNKASSAASWFKTDTTRTLDVAFKIHAEAKTPSEQVDQNLIKALDQWLEKKRDSKSKRYDLVVEIREHLQQVVDNTYQNPAEAGLDQQQPLIIHSY